LIRDHADLAAAQIAPGGAKEDFVAEFDARGWQRFCVDARAGGEREARARG